MDELKTAVLVASLLDLVVELAAKLLVETFPALLTDETLLVGALKVTLDKTDEALEEAAMNLLLEALIDVVVVDILEFVDAVLI